MQTLQTYKKALCTEMLASTQSLLRNGNIEAALQQVFDFIQHEIRVNDGAASSLLDRCRIAVKCTEIVRRMEVCKYNVTEIWMWSLQTS